MMFCLELNEVFGGGFALEGLVMWVFFTWSSDSDVEGATSLCDLTKSNNVFGFSLPKG